MTAKLIRDRMDGVAWTHDSAKSTVRPVEDRVEHLKLLRRKLLEEAIELYEAETAIKIVEEAGDLMDVMKAYLEVLGIPRSEVAASRLAKTAERGGFIKGLVWEY